MLMSNTNFGIETISMGPANQTAPTEQSDLGPHCLQQFATKTF